MDIFEAIKTRRSIRKYKLDSIPAEKLEKILEAVRLAPSAANRQPWRFVIVRDTERRKALARAANNQMFIADAAIIVAALGDPEVSQRWYSKDVMTAVEHMALAATALGYGTCWIGAFDEEKVKHLLNIPESISVIALLPIGVPDENPPPRPRKEIPEVFFDEEYDRPISMR